eukprot:4804292-Prymnesium_polylepis.1
MVVETAPVSAPGLRFLAFAAEARSTATHRLVGGCVRIEEVRGSEAYRKHVLSGMSAMSGVSGMSGMSG